MLGEKIVSVLVMFGCLRIDGKSSSVRSMLSEMVSFYFIVVVCCLFLMNSSLKRIMVLVKYLVMVF